MVDTVLFSNNASTTLDGGITDSATTIDVVDASVFGAVGANQIQYLTLDDGVNIEIVKCTFIAANALTVVRGVDGTSGTAFSDGASIYARIPALVLETLAQNKADNPTTGIAIGEGLSGAASGYEVQLGYASNSTSTSAVTIGRSAAAGLNCVSIGYSATCTATKSSAVAIGYQAVAENNQAIAIGTSAGAELGAISIGGSSKADDNYAIAIGYQAEAYDQYAISIGYQTDCANLYQSCIAIGNAATATGGSKGVAIGYQASVTLGETVAIGSEAFCRRNKGFVSSGAPLIPYDDGTSYNAFQHGCAAQSVFMSEELDLTVGAADDIATIAIPSGMRWFTDEIGFVCTDFDTVTVLPDVAIGTSTGAGDIVSTVTLNASVDAAYSRDTALSTGVNDALTGTIYISLKVTTTGTTLKGRFYFRGFMLDQQAA